MSESLNQQIDRLQEILRLDLDPDGRAFVPLADAHRRLGDMDQALALVRKGLEEHPDFASGHVVEGWIHRAQGDVDTALKSFERVVELDPENTMARLAVAELIDDMRARTYREKIAAQKLDRPVVPVASLAPDERPVVPVASLAPDDAPEVAAPDSTPGGEPAVAEEPSPERPLADGDIYKIYTRTLAELYAGQGGIDKAIEVYRKLVSDDLENSELAQRLNELENIASGERSVVLIESLAPDSADGEGSSADYRTVVPIGLLAPDDASPDEASGRPSPLAE